MWAPWIPAPQESRRRRGATCCARPPAAAGGPQGGQPPAPVIPTVPPLIPPPRRGLSSNAGRTVYAAPTALVSVSALRASSPRCCTNAAVVGAKDRETKKIAAEPVARTDRETLQGFVHAHVTEWPRWPAGSAGSACAIRTSRLAARRIRRRRFRRRLVKGLVQSFSLFTASVPRDPLRSGPLFSLTASSLQPLRLPRLYHVCDSHDPCSCLHHDH